MVQGVVVQARILVLLNLAQFREISNITVIAGSLTSAYESSIATSKLEIGVDNFVLYSETLFHLYTSHFSYKLLKTHKTDSI